MIIDILVDPDKGPTLSSSATHPAAPRSSLHYAVIDTNVVLDLWVFNDPRAQRLQQALSHGRLHWLGTDAMFEELADVLSRPTSARWCKDPSAVLTAARACCQVLPAEAMPPGNVRRVPTCADPDDQMFIDLAWTWPAAWLFSRDRAVLDLARPALAHGLVITTPADWLGQDTGRC
jgi:predicted nucleic acid-binding protein